MAIMVQKYGGTSVGDVERIQVVADKIVAAKEAGYEVVVVVSAMGRTTDELLRMARELTPVPQPRELDMLLTAGERIAMSLLAIALNARGCRAASYTGSQAGIITDTQFGKAKIIDVRPGRILDALNEGNVVIVAGFQGVSTTLDVTTLGRGGSDTTAVALAAALDADYCEISTDVTGVFTADPRIVPDARKITRISYDEMLELAAGGAKVLQLRCVEYARRNGVRIHVRSSFEDEEGTWVQEEDPAMEQALVSGVALDTDEAKVTLQDVPDRPGVAAAIFKAVASEGINVDMIVQNVSHDGTTDLSFTAPRDDLPKLKQVMDQIAADVGGGVRYSADDDIAKISLVGAGMKSNPGVAADMFDALAAEGINIEMISTSSIRVSCIVRRDQAERAMRAVHKRFDLSHKPGGEA